MASDKVTQRDMQFLILLMSSNQIGMQASSLVVSLLFASKISSLWISGLN